MRYDKNGEISGVNENMAVVLVDIPLNKIPGLDPETFQEEFVEDTNPNAAIPPLPPNPPPEEASTIIPKLEQETTPHIDTEEIVVEYTLDADYTEYIPPIEITHNNRDEYK